MHCSRQVWRLIVSNRKACESPFSSPLLRLQGFRLVRRRRQYKYRVWYSIKPLVVARVAARFPADKQLTNCELRLLDHQLPNFVIRISRPRRPVRKWQLGLSKGLFLGERHNFSDESPTNENERFLRPRLLPRLCVVRGNYKRGEQRMHQNGEGRKTRGGGKYFAPAFRKW